MFVESRTNALNAYSTITTSKQRIDIVFVRHMLHFLQQQAWVGALGCVDSSNVKPVFEGICCFISSEFEFIALHLNQELCDPFAIPIRIVIVNHELFFQFGDSSTVTVFTARVLVQEIQLMKIARFKFRSKLPQHAGFDFGSVTMRIWNKHDRLFALPLFQALIEQVSLDSSKRIRLHDKKKALHSQEPLRN